MQIRNVLQTIHREIGRCHFVSCFDLQSGLPLDSASEQDRYDSETISAAFGSILDLIMVSQQKARNQTVRTILKGFTELILETSLSSFFVLVPDRNIKMAVVIGAPVDVKIGFIRLCIKKHLQEMTQALRSIMA